MCNQVTRGSKEKITPTFWFVTYEQTGIDSTSQEPLLSGRRVWGARARPRKIIKPPLTKTFSTAEIRRQEALHTTSDPLCTLPTLDSACQALARRLDGNAMRERSIRKKLSLQVSVNLDMFMIY